MLELVDLASGDQTLFLSGEFLSFTHSLPNAGLRYFSDVGIHSVEADSLVNGNNRDCVTFLSDEEISIKPDPSWKANQYRVLPTKVRELFAT